MRELRGDVVAIGGTPTWRITSPADAAVFQPDGVVGDALESQVMRDGDDSAAFVLDEPAKELHHLSTMPRVEIRSGLIGEK